ncbi:MAG: tetratricopeptide repeat protein, partial [Deltaproteobacteria bacterium]|nr:tetratricopeptide repeat protein [Deltaproteobacteria bacterium]
MIRSASPWLAAALTLTLSLSALADDARKAGDEAYANKKWREAAVAYEKLAADDKVGDVTYRLAFAEHNLGKYKEAQGHYERAFKLGFRVPGGFYNLACAQARNAQPDAAFESLNKVIQASFVTSDQMVADDDLVSLHKDARWEPLIAKLRLAEHPCETPNHHAFDFWLGNWVVKNPAGVTVGQSHVDRILNGCVLLENWTDVAKHEGKSFNRFEPKSK